MKGQLYKFYKLIEKKKGDINNPYITSAEKAFICLHGFIFFMFLFTIVAQIFLVVLDTFPLWAPIITFALMILTQKIMQKSVNEILDRAVFAICLDIEEDLYGEDKEEC